ncbi:unnamed protein product [Sphagnum balticum]
MTDSSASWESTRSVNLRRTGKILIKRDGCDHSDGFPRFSDLYSMSESIKPTEVSDELPAKISEPSDEPSEKFEQ